MCDKIKEIFADWHKEVTVTVWSSGIEKIIAVREGKEHDTEEKI